jgi:hypothetical protein
MQWMALALEVGGALAGGGLIALGVHFLLVVAPYRKLLRQAGREGVEHYQGWREGGQWEVGVESEHRNERFEVADGELGKFLLRQALGRVDSEKARWMVMATSQEVGLDVASPFEFARARRWGNQMERRPLDKFMVDRWEILRLCSSYLRADMVLKTRT